MSGFWATLNDQSQFGQIQHALAEEFAHLDLYISYVAEQQNLSKLDPVYAHNLFSTQFALPGNWPRSEWYDENYRDFLSGLPALYLAGSHIKNIEEILRSYLKLIGASHLNLQIRELSEFGGDSVSSIADQHVIEVRIEKFGNLSHLTSDIYHLVKLAKPLHTAFRLVVEVVDPQWIHTATIKSTFQLKLFLVESRWPIQYLRWSDTDRTVLDPTNTGWFQAAPGQPGDISQVVSGVFAPGVLPLCRYKVRGYFFDS